VLAGGPVVGVEVADDEATPVEKQHHRRRFVIAWRPVDPDVDRPGRPVDGAVLHPKLGIEAAPRQIPQFLASRFDAAIGG
jgi:hypothetical protein